MICIQNPLTLEVLRLPDREAHDRVNRYGWRYVSKRIFKAWQVEKMEAARG